MCSGFVYAELGAIKCAWGTQRGSRSIKSPGDTDVGISAYGDWHIEHTRVLWFFFSFEIAHITNFIVWMCVCVFVVDGSRHISLAPRDNRPFSESDKADCGCFMGGGCDRFPPGCLCGWYPTELSVACNQVVSGAIGCTYGGCSVVCISATTCPSITAI